MLQLIKTLHPAFLSLESKCTQVRLSPTIERGYLPLIKFLSSVIIVMEVFSNHGTLTVLVIAHPHVLVRATSERFLSTLVTSNGSHWLNQL